MKGTLEIQHERLELVRRQGLEQQPYLLIIENCERHCAKKLQNAEKYKKGV